jgi:hypothetical protein
MKRLNGVGEAKIICEDCGKRYSIDIEQASDLFGLKCRFCKSDNIWYEDIQLEVENNSPIVLGSHTTCKFKK